MFPKRELTLLLLNDLLRLGQVKGPRFVLAGHCAFQIQAFAILCFNFLPAGARRQVQDGPQTLLGNRAPLSDRLRITAVSIILGILTQPCANRVQIDVGGNRRHSRASFQQNTLEAFRPQRSVTLVASIVLLSEVAFELFHKDREVIHLSEIEVEQALALFDSVGLLSKARQLLSQLLHSFRPVAVLNALQQFALGQGLWFRHFAKEVEVIGHQHIVQDPNAAEGRPAAHQQEKFLSLRTTASGGPEDEKAMNESGNAVVKTPTLSFDTGKSHNQE